MIGCDGESRLTPETLSRAREEIAGACRGSAPETSQNFICSPYELRAHMGPTNISTPPLWGKCSGSGRRKNTHLRGIEPSNLGSDPTPIGQ